MWSRDGNLDNRDGAVFQPNHFVTLLLRGNKTVTDTNKITNIRKDEKQKNKSSKELRTDNKTQQKLPAFFTNAAPTLKNACHQEQTLTGEKSGSTKEETEVNNDVTEEQVKSTANIQSSHTDPNNISQSSYGPEQTRLPPERNAHADMDISSLARNRHQLTNQQKCDILSNATGRLSEYPSHGGKVKRRYNPTWEQTYSWLRYSPQVDGVLLCVLCCICAQNRLS